MPSRPFHCCSKTSKTPPTGWRPSLQERSASCDWNLAWSFRLSPMRLIAGKICWCMIRISCIRDCSSSISLQSPRGLRSGGPPRFAGHSGMVGRQQSFGSRICSRHPGQAGSGARSSGARSHPCPEERESIFSANGGQVTWSLWSCRHFGGSSPDRNCERYQADAPCIL